MSNTVEAEADLSMVMGQPPTSPPPMTTTKGSGESAMGCCQSSPGSHIFPQEFSQELGDISGLVPWKGLKSWQLPVVTSSQIWPLHQA